ncbi:hypothetical protein V6N11_049621 [Hibiscus sabdariffa]|uniref:Uncharacterized protein n=1 Tax=Hibiscus sabdariffa TaxID=183260 RepID=A0ABR1ZQV2_9ROSI
MRKGDQPSLAKMTTDPQNIKRDDLKSLEELKLQFNGTPKNLNCDHFDVQSFHLSSVSTKRRSAWFLIPPTPQSLVYNTHFLTKLLGIPAKLYTACERLIDGEKWHLSDS